MITHHRCVLVRCPWEYTTPALLPSHPVMAASWVDVPGSLSPSHDCQLVRCPWEYTTLALLPSHPAWLPAGEMPLGVRYTCTTSLSPSYGCQLGRCPWEYTTSLASFPGSPLTPTKNKSGGGEPGTDSHMISRHDDFALTSK